MPDINLETALIPAILGLLGGVISGYLGGLITFRRQRRHDRELLAITLRNEVLYHAVNLHEYRTSWREFIDDPDKFDSATFGWPFTENQTEIYRANLSKIGLLSTDSATEVILYYANFRVTHTYMINLLTPEPSESLDYSDVERIHEESIDAMDRMNTTWDLGAETIKRLTSELPLTNKARRSSIYIRTKNRIRDIISHNKAEEDF